ncbi:MAG: response regulator [Treponema sp.]|jgi:CheY-like chemotaxis protein|nr:response regulator [Treponema sp.]
MKTMKTVFVVDDSDTNLTMAEEALEDNFNVITVPSAAKMFEFFEKIMPDIILLDIQMPEMNGFEALERIKASASWANIPVIFLTGTIDVNIERRSKQLGAVDIVAKPFSAGDLLNRINTYLK